MDEDDEVPSTRLDPGVETWVRTRAIENYRSTGNPVGAVRMAIEAAQNASNAQKAARGTASWR